MSGAIPMMRWRMCAAGVGLLVAALSWAWARGDPAGEARLPVPVADGGGETPVASASPPRGVLVSGGSLQKPGAAAWQKNGHGWFVVAAASSPGTARPFVLLHLPPRSRSAPAGTVGRAAALGAAPEAIAAWEGEAFLIFPPIGGGGSGGGGGGAGRAVARVMALPTLAETWTYFPEAAPEARPSLTAEGQLVAAAGTAVGALAIVRSESGKLEGWLLRPAGWLRVDVPSPESGGALRCWLVPGREGPLLVMKGDRLGAAKRGALKVVRENGQERVEASWTSEDLPIGSLTLSDRTSLWEVDGQLVAATVSGDRSVRVRTVRSSGSALLADVPAPTPTGPVAVVPLDGAGRVAVTRLVAEGGGEAGGAGGGGGGGGGGMGGARGAPAAGAEPAGVLRITEVSVHTGAVQFDGPAAGALLAPWQMQVLMAVIGAVMVAVLLFVLRSESKTPLVLPEGFALASPSRRFAAAAVDLALVTLGIAVAWRIPPTEIVSAAVLTGSPRALLPIASIMAGGWVYATVTEAWLGRTLGKRLFGAVVFGIRPAGKAGGGGSGASVGETRVGDQVIARPTVVQAAVRNLVRWGVPPLAVLILIDPNWRHPGDVLSSTVVAEPVGEGDEDEGEPE